MHGQSGRRVCFLPIRLPPPPLLGHGAVPDAAVAMPLPAPRRRRQQLGLHHLIQHVDHERPIHGHPAAAARRERLDADCAARPADSRSRDANSLSYHGSRKTVALTWSQIEGNLHNTNYSSVASIANSEIAYISCDALDYSGLVDAQRVFTDAYENANISGVILYSTAVDYCDYEQDTTQDMMESFPVLSMTNKQDALRVRDTLLTAPVSMKYFVHVQGRGNGGDDSSAGQQSQQNPLGPSPSTAVAMIILYSITGIITALFLVIIITGAIRAHRHPERYGPRNVLGRSRQSRARGLARAMLDTIPIVKFGEKEPSKPTDVELASSSETRDVAAVSVETTSQPVNTAAVGTGASDAQPKPNPNEVEIETSRNPGRVLAEDHQEGIAPAQSVLATATTGTDHAPNDENLGCSICTEDFEKGQDLRVLPCDHKFHPECVDPWLLNVSGTCPLW